MVTKHWKVFSTIIGQQQEKILDSTYSRMSNIFTLVTAFNRFCFETLSFVPLFSYYLFAMQRCGVHGPTISPSAAHPISRYAKIIENSFPQFIKLNHVLSNVNTDRFQTQIVLDKNDKTSRIED